MEAAKYRGPVGRELKGHRAGLHSKPIEAHIMQPCVPDARQGLAMLQSYSGSLLCFL